MRERKPWRDLRGRLARTCVFADGHPEIHRAATLEELEAWEHERTSQGQHGGSRAISDGAGSP